MPSLQNYGIPTGDSINRGGILMPKIKNRFRVMVSNFGITGQVGFTQQVITVARPNVNYPPQPVHSYNSISYYAGKAEWETITVTVRDDVTNSVATLIGAQMQKQMNFFEQTVPMSAGDYKFQMLVDSLDGGGITGGADPVILEEWFYEGCFLSNVNYQSYDYSSSDAMTIEMTVRFDNASNAATMPDPALFPNNLNSAGIGF